MVPNRSLTRTMTMRSGYGNLHCNQENPVLLPSFGCCDIDPKENRANMSEDYFGLLLVRNNSSVEGVAISRTSKQVAGDSYGPPRGVGEPSSRVDNTSVHRLVTQASTLRTDRAIDIGVRGTPDFEIGNGEAMLERDIEELCPLLRRLYRLSLGRQWVN